MLENLIKEIQFFIRNHVLGRLSFRRCPAPSQYTDEENQFYQLLLLDGVTYQPLGGSSPRRQVNDYEPKPDGSWEQKKRCL